MQDKFKNMSTAELYHAITDINITLHIWRDAPVGDKYVEKLYLELDSAQKAFKSSNSKVR